jgi:membrane-associated protease RseP (regulator of RpoE activity)
VEIMFWLAVFGVGFSLSLAAHEAGHVVVGLRHGWEVAGFYFKPAALGIGVRMGHRSTNPVDWHLGPVAVAGPVASFFVAGVFWSIEPLPDGGGVLGALAGINVAVAVINLLPTPITDGGHILRGLFGWTLRWRHMAVAWVLLELGGAALFLLLGHRVA